MYMQSVDSVRAFRQEEEHNTEAPSEQNEKCSRKAARTVIFQDSVDKDSLRSLKPQTSTPPAPTFKLIQRGRRVVCLILDPFKNSLPMQNSLLISVERAHDVADFILISKE